MRPAILLAALAGVSCGPAAPPAPDPAHLARSHAAGTWRVLELVDARVERFFAARDAGIDRFVDDLVSLKGKWRALFWGEADFREHIRRRFESRLFSPEDLNRELLDPVRRDLAFMLDAAEAGLALDLERRASAARIAPSGPDLRVEVSDSTARLVAQDLNMNLVAVLGSEYVAVITTSALAQSGLFGAAVAAGASQSWWNFGIGLVAGVVAGIVIDVSLGDVCEDAIRACVRAEMDRVRSKLLFDADGLAGSIRRLLRAHESALVAVAGGFHEGRG